MFIKLLFIAFLVIVSSDGHKLKQVVVLSRHNIRTPLAANMESLTPKVWPLWNGEIGHLTPKGRLLERFMGKYFTGWMVEEKLINNNCPKDEVLVYANTKHRTVETAKSFAEGAFGDCVQVYHKNTTEFDPVFHPIIRNGTAEFRETIIDDMRKKLNIIDLNDAFKELNEIVDFANSSYCRTENICDLSEAKSDVVFELNEEPEISGALKIGTTLVDAFLMAYYDGMSPENVAWGKIQTAKQWDTLLKILKLYHELRFETKILNRDVASTLLEYLTNIFQNGTMKFYFLVGHDANILSLMSSLKFTDYVLHDQLEKTPIGGKVVFQKWYDEENDRDLLRVNYVYQSTKQIRDGVEVNLRNPPLWEILKMKNCAVDENGFCLWSDFINNLITI